jgi:hypothetical protein
MAYYLSYQLRPDLGNAICDGMNEVIIAAPREDRCIQQGSLEPFKY